MNVLYVDLAIVSQDQNKLTDTAIYIGNALKAGRRISNISCIAFALVALGNYRIAQATGQNRAEASASRLLLRAKRTLEYALQIEGLDVETKLKGANCPRPGSVAVRRIRKCITFCLANIR